MTLIRLIATAFCAVLMGMAQPVQAQDWQLVDADTISTDSYLILTVPLETPEALSEIAAEIEATYGVPLAAEWPLQAIAVHCLIFDASAIADVDGLIAAMQADQAIRTVQRMQGFVLSQNTDADPLFQLQWSLEKMNVAAAHLHTMGDGVRIGVVDSAMDRNHPDLTDRVLDARDFVSAKPGQHAEAHGTAMAGIIAAEVSNNIGMVGVAPKAGLLGLRACWQATGQSGACNSFSLARALNFALLNDVNVLNLSLGGPDDPLLKELIEAAIAQGMIVVAASGETETLEFPASINGVIAAGNALAGSIPAPMTDVLTTSLGAGHHYVSGSSVATAHVSGVVALMLAQDPSLTQTQIAQALANSVGRDDQKPMLNACEALSRIDGSGMLCDR